MKLHHSQSVLFHGIFWLITLSTNVAFLVFRGNEVPAIQYLASGIKSVLEVLVFYFFYGVIIPLSFPRKPSARFFGIVIATLVMLIPAYAGCMTIALLWMKLAPSASIFRFELVMATYYVILYAFLGGFFRLAIDGIRVREQKILLEQEHVKTELALLRSQVHPHFLFNTLNTIHSYVTENHPDRAEAVILLSDIMRYMLVEGNADEILLEKEVAYIRNYIRLHEMRFESHNRIAFQVDGDPGGIRVAPMLFIPFVENAFKHGSVNHPLQPIRIRLSIEPTSLSLKVTNPIPSMGTILPADAPASGHGLQNIRRRLDLLFPGKHQLDLFVEQKTFTVNLILSRL